MKLEDIKAPKGFEIRGYETPEPGDYILCPDNRFDIADPAENPKQFCIVLDRVWEPEIGKYYEFSDYVDFPTPILRKYVGSAYAQNTTLQYLDETGESWRYIRPVEKELLGK